eukprot:scaffold213362_cov18-Tisochrysis_lutea.AAC.1
MKNVLTSSSRNRRLVVHSKELYASKHKFTKSSCKYLGTEKGVPCTDWGLERGGEPMMMPQCLALEFVL